MTHNYNKNRKQKAESRTGLILLLCMVMLFLLNGCGDSDTDMNSLDNNEASSDTDLASSVTNTDYSTLTTLDVDYIMETDDQPDYNEVEGKKTYTEDGYYYFVSENINSDYLCFLYYHDDSTGVDVAVCSKANCSHQDEDCDAYFDDQYIYELFYSDGSLYIFRQYEDYNIIERISMDGTQRETSCTLFRIATESGEEDDGSYSVTTYYPEIAIHRGYVFYSDYYPGCTECALYCVKLDSDEEPTKICSLETDSPWIYRLKGYGEYLFFQMGVYLSDEDTYDISIYAYNIETQEISYVVDAIRNYTVGDDYVYYFDRQDNVFAYQVSTEQTTQIIDSGGTYADEDVYLFVKDGLFYYADANEQQVYDSEGSLVETLTGDDMIVPYTD